MISQYSILLVDDEKDYREVVQRFLTRTLKEKKLRIEQAADGIEALSKMERSAFDLVITDLRMPSVDGSSLLASLRSIKPECRPAKVLVLSAYLDERSKSAFPSHVTYMAKPFQEATFADYVRWALSDEESELAAAPSFLTGANALKLLVDSATFVVEEVTGKPPERELILLHEVAGLTVDVSSTIPFAGDDYEGSFGLGFDSGAFLYLAGRLAGQPLGEVNPYNRHYAAELCSRIAGRLRRALEGTGRGVKMEEPTVDIRGKHAIRHGFRENYHGVTFMTPAGRVVVEIVARSRDDGK